MSPMAEAMTTAASALCRQVLKEIGRRNEEQGDGDRPDNAGHLRLAPAASATGVREELLLIGKP